MRHAFFSVSLKSQSTNNGTLDPSVCESVILIVGLIHVLTDVVHYRPGLPCARYQSVNPSMPIATNDEEDSAVLKENRLAFPHFDFYVSIGFRVAVMRLIYGALDHR